MIDTGNAIAGLKDIFEEGETKKAIPFEVETKTGWGKAANVITQAALGLIPGGAVVRGLSTLSKAAKVAQGIKLAGKGASVVKGLAAGAIGDFMAFDGTEERLSDLLVEIPATRNFVTEFLASAPGDGKALGRFKNSLEGLGIGAAAEVVLHYARVVKGVKNGNIDEAVKAAEEAGTSLTKGDKPLELSVEDIQKTFGSEVVQTTGKEAERLLKSVPEEKLASYGDFVNSKADKRLKNVIEYHSESLAAEVKDLMKAGEDDIAAAYNKAISSNRTFAKFSGGVKDNRLITLVNEAVRSKVVTRMSEREMKAEAARLVDMGFIDENVSDALKADAGFMRNFAPRLSVYRMNAVQKSNKLLKTIQQRLMGDVEGTADIKDLIESFGEDIAGVQSIISENARSLGSLRFDPAAVGSKTMKAEDLKPKFASGAKADKAVKQGVNKLEGTPLNQLTAADLVFKEKDLSGAWNLMKFGFDPDNAEHLQAILSLAGDKANNKFIRLFADTGKTGYKERSFRALFSNSLLSSPATHVYNIVGNTIKMVMSPAARIAGGILGGNFDAIKSGVRQYAAYASVFSDSLKMAGAALKRGGSIIDQVGEKYPAINANRIAEDFQMQFAKANIDKGMNPIDAYNSVPDHIKSLSRFVGFAGATGQLPIRVMGAADEFFKQMAYRSSVYSKASLEAASLRVADKAAHIKDEMELAFNEGRAMDEDALRYAREMTWTQELKDDSRYSISNAAAGLSKIKALYPFAPFIKTPTNLLKDIVSHSPFAKFSSEYKEAIKAGGMRAVEAEGKIFIGQALSFTAMGLAAEGRITGAYPKDSVERQLWIDQGKLPYSFKIGDKYVPFNRLDPFGAFFGIVADLHDYGLRGGDGTDAAMGLVAGVVKNISNKTYLTGLIDGMEMITDPDSKKAGYVAGNFAMGLVPFSAGLRFTARMIDPEMKETRGIMDKLMAMTPVASLEQPSRYSWVTGKPQEVSYFSSDAKQDAVLEELLTNAEAVRGGTPPKIIQDVTLSAKQFSDLNRLQGSVRMNGVTLYESLERLFDSPSYQNADDTPDYDGRSGKSEKVTKIIRRYRNAAISELKKQDPSIERDIMETRQKQRELEKQKQEKRGKYDLRQL